MGVTVKATPNVLRTFAAPFASVVQELRETPYWFTSPYVMDLSAITAFALEPTPWDEACRRTALVTGCCVSSAAHGHTRRSFAFSE